MYARTEEELQDALSTLRNEKGSATYLARFEKFYERREEWVLLLRKNVMTRSHNTNNYAEVTIRILKDIVLSRTKAFNLVALVDFCIFVWEKYFQKRIMQHALNRDHRSHLLYQRMTNKMTKSNVEGIKKENEYVYIVPSQNNKEQLYTVNTLAGTCSCTYGEQGAFCKHMAILAEKYNICFPNAPAISYNERFKLGKLALGNKCPNVSFFYDYKNVQSPTMSMTHEDDSMLPDTSSPTQPENDTTPVFQQDGQADLERNSSKLNEVSNELTREILRLKSVLDETCADAVEKLVSCLKKVHNSSQVKTICMNLSSNITRNIRKGGRIKVQPTAIARRRAGITKGCRRLPSGRPPVHAAEKRKKRPHLIATNIMQNVPNSISHGHGH